MDHERDGDFKTYVCSYPYEGGSWSLEIKATSMKDAEARLAACQYGTVDGSLIGTYRVGFGWLAKLVCWVKNRFFPEETLTFELGPPREK